MSFKPAFSYLAAKELATLLRTPGVKLAVVDVRDDDYEGGHIRGCIHSPSATFLDGGVDRLREQLKETPMVVFHCALSQVRGPKAARIYAETVDEIRRKGGEAPVSQDIYVLRGGFGEFQALYKNEKDLIEEYDAAFWDY
ncbi:Rhodanese-like protein [Serendipita vermifera]|nr:Rhodanese-like protein [Serendipita vermifera]